MESASEMIGAFPPSKEKKNMLFKSPIFFYLLWVQVEGSSSLPLHQGASGNLGNPRFSSLSILFVVCIFFLLSLNTVIVGRCGGCCWLDMWVVNNMATIKGGEVSRKKH